MDKIGFQNNSMKSAFKSCQLAGYQIWQPA